MTYGLPTSSASMKSAPTTSPKAAAALGSDDYQSRLSGFNRKSRMPMVRMPWLS